MFARVGIITLAVGTLMVLPTRSFADSSSTDWTMGVGGTYSYAGGSNPLIGTDIPIVSVLGDTTPADNGVLLPIVDGLLSFTSGTENGTWSWGSGTPGTLNITGCIAGLTASSCTGSNNVVLVADDFQSVQIVPVIGAIDVEFGNVTGTVNGLVASYFGLAPTFSTGSFTTAIVTSGSPGQAFTGTNLLGVLKADPPVSAPENWGLVEYGAFLMFALLVFGAMTRFGTLRSHLFQWSIRQ